MTDTTLTTATAVTIFYMATAVLTMKLRGFLLAFPNPFSPVSKQRMFSHVLGHCSSIVPG